MKYKLDINGYVCLVLWGCNSGDSQEYTGEIPAGYTSLVSWAENAVINAYYIDSNGNLVLDTQREKELKILAEQQAIDYSPVLRRDLYETQEVLDSQYIKVMSSAVSKKILALENVKNIPPYVKLKNLSSADTITFFAQTKNMLKNDAVTETINGVSFTRNPDGQIVISGTATADVEYNLSGGSGNTTPIFALLTDVSYYLRIGSLSCEMRYFNGETTEQVYSGGTSSAITPAANKKVTQVVIKIPSGTAVDKSFYPTLSDSATEIDYEEYKCKLLTFDVGTITDSDAYIKIENGLIILYESEEESLLGQGNVALLSGDQIVYTDQGNPVTIKYSINKLAVEDLSFLQGKATTTNKFQILDDGSIRANNGYFGGELLSESGTIGGWNIDDNSLWCNITPPNETLFTNADVTKVQNYIVGTGTLTGEELTKYDISGDGQVNSLDLLMISGLVTANMSKNNPGKLVFDTTDWRFPVKVLDYLGIKRASFGLYGAEPGPGDYVESLGISGAWEYRKWFSGKAELWLNTSWARVEQAGTYMGAAQYMVNNISYPIELKAAPFVIGWGKAGTGYGYLSYINPTASSVSVAVASNQSGTAKVTLSLYVMGEWK